MKCYVQKNPVYDSIELGTSRSITPAGPYLACILQSVRSNTALCDTKA